jgi:hypothetical protein
LPRAFALASDGRYGWLGGGGTSEDARARALKSCADKGGADCSIYAEDLQVVWRGRAPVALPQPPGALFANRDFALAPDQRYFWFGPGVARGVFVWGHGKSLQDERSDQPQAYVRAFNNVGFDVVDFQRAPSADYADVAADFLRQGLAKLRATGWRMVVVAGQSRGAWNSLQMLDTPGLADAVIAVSPASFNSNNQSAQDSDLYRIVHAARSPAARVAVVEFSGDVYVRDMPGRIDILRGLEAPRVAAAMIIDEPDGITGHGGGKSGTFARRYGRCLLRFVTDPSPTATCP